MTEFLVVLIIIFMLLFMLGGISFVLVGLGFSLVLASAAVFGFFVYSLISLLRCKRKKAFFVEIKKSGKYGFKAAIYKIEDQKLANSFPCEAVLSRLIYVKNKECTVFHRGKRVYDKISCVTIVSGLAAGGVMTFVTAVHFLQIAGFV